MQISQVITVLGLCLSQTHALAVSPPTDDAIKSLVNLATQPPATLEKSPMFSDVADALRQKAHSMNHEQFHQQLISSISPLVEGHQQTAVYLGDSFYGYQKTLVTRELDSYPEVKAKRLQAYRNSLYSQLKDLAGKGSKKFNADSVEKARASLVSLLSKNGGAGQFDSEALLEKLGHEITHPVTPVPGADLEKLDREVINKQLESTNLPGVPDAPLIDGSFIQQVMAEYHTHAHHHQQFPSTVPAPKPLTAAT
ncbi:hypothetical protein VP01_3239g2 [Puccinia sorghi]|uniref:Uncharacterized protein n=1 Tax=Puccinia sorghi TaxID=27349 RepID=A0A0L6UY18_9BASI|nr:hypothetical protein VP01_3239g2 [Puccinia sorghi]